jgi:hypothetical protein
VAGDSYLSNTWTVSACWNWIFLVIFGGNEGPQFSSVTVGMVMKARREIVSKARICSLPAP